MKLTDKIKIIGPGLFIDDKILVLSDFHFGYEEMLTKRGIMIPRFQYKDIEDTLKRVLSEIKPEKIIITGDLKHEFGKLNNQEWREIRNTLDFLKTKCREIIVIKGNHDTALISILRKLNVKLEDKFVYKNFLTIHGDKEIKIPKAVDTIIIGHEHPAIKFYAVGRKESYKCFLITKYKEKTNLKNKLFGKSKTLIVLPSMNPLTEGTDLLNEKYLSPFIKKAKGRVIIYHNNEHYDFGELSKLKKLTRQDLERLF